MDRCELALANHQGGYNCAQSVVLSFAEDTGVSRETLLAIVGGMGGGVGGTREELCGAISGGTMVLGVFAPFADPEKTEDRRRLYGYVKEFRKRYAERFGGLTQCGALLRSRVEPSEEMTPAAVRVGAKKHCDIMVVTAVEIVEQILKEEGLL